jgi:hypothetical protein
MTMAYDPNIVRIEDDGTETPMKLVERESSTPSPDLLAATRRADIAVCSLPEDVRGFIQGVTLFLQQVENNDRNTRVRWFDSAYALYSKYDVEGRRADNAESGY